MIQNPRSSNSRSLLREAESAILLIEDVNVKKWFEMSINRVINKRKDPNCTFTGAKELKTNLLSYLKQNGEIKTANIWCRKIIYSDITNFLSKLKNFLTGKNLTGVVELHLQDREINSPHIQYVGTNAALAQKEIAQFVVGNNFEDNFESAIMQNYKPAYFTQEPKNLRVKSTDEEIEIQKISKQKAKNISEIKSRISEKINSIKSLHSEFLDIIQDDVIQIYEKINRRKRVKTNRTKDTNTLLKELKNRRRNRKK